MSLNAEPFSAPDAHELAAFFPGYSIDSLIACGGMGAVYHARQVALDREVAIKILPREFSADEAFREGFAAEARAMAKLNHPNLIGVYDFGEADGMLFIIMEFVPGQSLYHATYQTKVEPREAARLMTEICAGLAEAHRHGILHRDIKPANILLDSHSRPKIGDFGLARPIGTATKEGEVIYGTPHYTAPEVLNLPSQVDARADVFSLGVMLHELLTGKLPANDTRPPSAISGCSPKFDAIVKRATQPVPALRYPDAAAMEADLKPLAAVPAYAAAAQAGRKRPPSVRRPHATQTVVKTSGGSGFGWIFLLLLLAGGGYYYYTNHYQKPAAAEEPAEEKPTVRVEDHLQPTERKVEPEKRPDLPGLPQEESSSGSRIFDTPTAPPGTPVEERPKSSGPAPVFDIAPFYERVRGIMFRKISDERTIRNRTLAVNADAFEKEVSRAARTEGAAAVTGAAEAVKTIRQNGNRIPEVFKIEGLSDNAYAEAYDNAVKAQEQTDQEYRDRLKPHAETYVHGMNLQIQRLKESNDPGAVRILEEEVKKVQEDPDYFRMLMDTYQ